MRMRNPQMAATPDISFTTLSNLVLGELHFPGKPVLKDVVGVPGAYGTFSL